MIDETLNREAAAAGAAPIDVDDCWNRIGTSGDRSCERLAACLRCLNCPVYAHHAARLLERPLDAAEMADGARRLGAHGPHASRRRYAPCGAGVSRRGRMAGAADRRVARDRRDAPDSFAAASPPFGGARRGEHSRHAAHRDLAGALLGLDAGKTCARGADGGFTRLLVAAHRGEPVVFPVDEVEGVLRFDVSEWVPVPATVGRAGAGLSRGVLSWRGSRWGCSTTTGCSTRSRGACDERR
jgi:chemotaxis-related protein WspD